MKAPGVATPPTSLAACSSALRLRSRNRIGEYVDIGVTDLNIAFRAPFDFDAVQSFIEEVMPAFK